jgi:hypothetical protein
MKRLHLVGAVLVTLMPSLAGLALAQDNERHQAADSIVILDDAGPDRMWRMMLNRRARLGIKVNLQSRDTDSLGAYVDAVTPSGPAAKAGVRSGDIITKLDGKSVLTGGRIDNGPRGPSVSGLRLIELAARLQPNDTVPVEFLRGKDKKTVSVVTERETDSFEDRWQDGRMPPMPGGPGHPGRDRMGLRGGDDFMERFDFPVPGPDFAATGPLADLELAPLNPDLGQYFGATEGVLVISVSKESKLGLKGGDVVVAVDGRKPTGPFNLMRILRSYDNGETFKLDILRNRKRETVNAQLGKAE